MATHHLVRKLASAASGLPFQRAHLMKSSIGNMVVARNGQEMRYMSSAAQQLTHDYKEAETEKQGNGAMYRERNFPLRVLDSMDSFFVPRSMRSMMEAMDRIFDDKFSVPTFRGSQIKRSVRPPWDFKETDDEFKMRLDMPGVAKENVKVYVQEDCLVIKSEHNAESKSEEEHWTSRSHENFSTRILLPENANREQIKAELKNGVLNVTLPKVQVEQKKIIDVNIE